MPVPGAHPAHFGQPVRHRAGRGDRGAWECEVAVQGFDLLQQGQRHGHRVGVDVDSGHRFSIEAQQPTESSRVAAAGIGDSLASGRVTE